MTKVLVGFVVAIMAGPASGDESAFPFSRASSLAVEPTSGQVAFLRDGQLLLWDGAREHVVLRHVAHSTMVSAFAGEHIRLELGDEEGPRETRVVHVHGREVARLGVGGELPSVSAGAMLSLDGNVVWQRLYADESVRRLWRSGTLPDGATVVMSREMASLTTRVRTISSPAENALPLPVADLLVLGVDDFLVTLKGGGVIRTTGGTISWQLPGEGGPPWRLFDAHLGLGLAALGDARGNLRLVRLADGGEQAAWRFAHQPAPLERFLAAAMGAQLWEKTRQTARDQQLRGAGGSSSPGGAAPLWPVRSAYFLAGGAVVAWLGPVAVVLLPGREEPLAELVTVAAALGLDGPSQLAGEPGKRLQQYRRKDAWAALFFDGRQYREVPPSAVRLTP